MRFLLTIAILVGLGFGGYWVWNNQPDVRNFVQKQLHLGEFYELEARYSIDKISSENSMVIFPNDDYSIIESKKVLYPHLLLKVKFLEKDRSKERIIIWDMEDGEMVIDADSWQKTHGFEDCINANVFKGDVRLINALAKNNKGLTYTDLHSFLQVESALFDKWIKSCTKKQLIIHNANKYKLHFENPKLAAVPFTKIKVPFSTELSKKATAVYPKYNRSQIERFAKVFFGDDFAIRSSAKVFLPVYKFKIRDPDGFVKTIYWNAFNGKQIDLNRLP